MKARITEFLLIFAPALTAISAVQANWIPTSAGGRFEVLFRFYGPDKTFFDKTWQLPDIAKI